MGPPGGGHHRLVMCARSYRGVLANDSLKSDFWQFGGVEVQKKGSRRKTLCTQFCHPRNAGEQRRPLEAKCAEQPFL